MKTLLLLTAFVCATELSSAATAYWSFQNAAGTVYTSTVTYQSGFTSSPTFASFAGTGGASTGNHGSGQAYTEPTTGTSYVSGYATYWDGGSTSATNLTGAGFTLGLDMTGLTDLSLRFDIRSASASATDKVGLPTTFSQINYRLNPGDAWTSSDITAPSWTVSPTGYYSYSMSLAALDAIEGQGTVELQFIFNGAEKGSSQPENLRIDNLQLNAVPEPSAALLLAPALGLMLSRRRKN